MKLEGIIKQLANRINQPHVVKTYLEKVADTCYDKGVENYYLISLNIQKTTKQVSGLMSV